MKGNNQNIREPPTMERLNTSDQDVDQKSN